MSALNLLPCPFCGSPAYFEQIGGEHATWSVGCLDENCMGFQSMARFPRKTDAAHAWNIRRGDVGALVFDGNGRLRSMEEIEAAVISAALGLFKGSKTDAARHLGIGRATLYRKLAHGKRS